METTHSAGWYPDPHGESVWRWFDGSAWTATTSDAQTVATPLVAAPGPAPGVEKSGRFRRRVVRTIAWGAGVLVAGFFTLVAIGAAFGRPLPSVEGAEVYTTFDESAVAHASLWFVVVDEGVDDDELERITEALLALPEADGPGPDVQFFTSDEHLDDYEELVEAFNTFDVDTILEAGAGFDFEALDSDRAGALVWSPDESEHYLCPGIVETCSATTAFVALPG